MALEVEVEAQVPKVGMGMALSLALGEPSIDTDEHYDSHDMRSIGMCMPSKTRKQCI